MGQFLLPSVPGRPKSENENILLLPLKSCKLYVATDNIILILTGQSGGYRLARAIPTHPEAFKFCAGWALWDGAWFTYGPLLSALFLETTGISFGAKEFTVFTLIGIIAACLGTLGWMYAFPHVRIPIKTWLFAFLGANIFCVFWGCIGISGSSAVGLKHTAEFWVIQVLFMSTNCALLAYNRVVFASFIPHGSEALFSGLIFILDLCTGWVLPVIQARIQDSTHNLRYSMLLCLGLMVASVFFFIWVNVEKGTREAGRRLAVSR